MGCRIEATKADRNFEGFDLYATNPAAGTACRIQVKSLEGLLHGKQERGLDRASARQSLSAAAAAAMRHRRPSEPGRCWTPDYNTHVLLGL
jgi:hypothetical protein